MKWVLILLFVQQEGVHSLSVPFGNQEACERAAEAWKHEDRVLKRMREIRATCHYTGVDRGR